MWALTGAGVAKHQTAANRAEPGATTNPPWYHKTNKGQAANLLEADVVRRRPRIRAARATRSSTAARSTARSTPAP